MDIKAILKKVAEFFNDGGIFKLLGLILIFDLLS